MTHTEIKKKNSAQNLLPVAARECVSTPVTALPLTCIHSSKRAGWFS